MKCLGRRHVKDRLLHVQVVPHWCCLLLCGQVLLNMLPAYHHHVKTYENTLITKFFGLHRIKPYGGQKVCAGHTRLLKAAEAVVFKECFGKIHLSAEALS